MIVKTLGKRLIFDTKLYLLISRLSPLIILLAPFVTLLLPLLQETSNFQEPTLRNKIYDYTLPKSPHPAAFNSDTGVNILAVQGLTGGECILMSFVWSQYQENLVSLLAGALGNQKVLTKTVLLVGYSHKRELDVWIDEYQSGRTKHNFGVIRAAVNLNLTEGASGVYTDIFGSNGRHCDSDYYFYLVEMMNKLRIKHKPCDYKLSFLKTLFSHLPNPVSAHTFLTNLACALKVEHQGHSSLLLRGIQSCTLSSARLDQSPLTQTQLISLLFSWVKQFSLQEDNLHSSYTLWLPTGKSHFVTAKIYILPYIIFIAGSVVRLLHNYFTSNLYWDMCRFRACDILFLVLMVSGICIQPGLYLAPVFLLLLLSKVVHGSRSEVEVEYHRFMVSISTVVGGIYNCIYFMPGSVYFYLAYLVVRLPRPISKVLLAAAVVYLLYAYSLPHMILLLNQMVLESHLSLIPVSVAVTWALF